jgi:hypothetical protein
MTSDKIRAAIEEANAICGRLGSDSQACVNAWNAVKALQTEDKTQPSQKTDFQAYCEEHPDASECRIYED